jgi:hypothetical protein
MIINSEHPAAGGLLLVQDGEILGNISAVNLTTGMATRKIPDDTKPNRYKIEIFTYQKALGNREVIPQYLWDELELYGVELYTPEELEQIRKELEE